MKVIILADFRVTPGSYFWLKEELEGLGYATVLNGIQDYNSKDETTRFGKLRIWKKYRTLAANAVKQLNDGDVILTDNFVIGAMAGYICRKKGKTNKVIALNMIAHQKGVVNSLLRKFVYNAAFSYPGFWFSVNDVQLKELYKKEFALPEERLFVLHDPFFRTDEQAEFSENGEFVFTGGDAYRDWDAVIDCADQLPAVRFVGVARKKYFPHRNLPSNLEMKFDTTQEVFYGLMKKSRLVFLPLNSQAPCGLIVMMKAALLSKPVIITETPSTRNYIKDSSMGWLVPLHDRKEMQKAIQTVYTDTGLQRSMTTSLKSYITGNFSTASKAGKIADIIEK